MPRIRIDPSLHDERWRVAVRGHATDAESLARVVVQAPLDDPRFVVRAAAPSDLE
jgi:hypothetical protein